MISDKELWKKEEARLQWLEAGLDIDQDCLCVGCPWEETCDWRYDVYNTKPGEPGWDCLGGK